MGLFGGVMRFVLCWTYTDCFLWKSQRFSCALIIALFSLGYSFFPFFFLNSPLDSNSSVTEGEVLKTLPPYARDLETFLLSLKLSFIVLISIYCCKRTSRKCEIGMSWIAPQSSRALGFCLQCGVGWALRESCPDGCRLRAGLQVFVSGAERRESSLEHTPSPLHLNKTKSPLVRMRRWWHWNKGFPSSIAVLVSWLRG